MIEAASVARSASDHLTGMGAVGLCYIGRKRPGFDQEWGGKVRDWCDRHIERVGWDTVHRPTSEIVDESSMLAALSELDKKGCEVLIVVQPTMSNGMLAHALAECWKGGVLLWATPERPVPEADRVSSCALVGNHLFASILAREGRLFELIYSESLESDPVEPLTQKSALLATAVGSRKLRAGVIGGTVPGFTNMRVDSAAWQRVTGIRIQHYPLDAFLESCANIPSDEIKQDLLAVNDLNLGGMPAEPDEGLIANSRVYLALQKLKQEQALDALAIRCWPEMPEVLQAWPYLALFRLSEMKFGNAMEGDVEGALSLELAYRLGADSGVLMDWIHHRDSVVTLWHPGNAPSGLSETEGPGAPRLGKHFNNGKSGVVESVIRPGLPVTLFRFWVLKGSLHFDGLEGITLPVEHPLMGTTGRVEISGPSSVGPWFEDACHRGLAHHLALIPGHWMNRLDRLHHLLKQI